MADLLQLMRNNNDGTIKFNQFNLNRFGRDVASGRCAAYICKTPVEEVCLLDLIEFSPVVLT